MKEKRQDNYIPGKTLREYAPGDTLYIQKMKGGFAYIYICEFVAIEKGMVVAKITEPKEDAGNAIRARASRCYAWGRGTGDKWLRCHWFSDGISKPAK